jgi:hypothetical protein
MLTVTKLEWLKDENGNFIYDEAAIEKFRKKAIKTIERQNKKIAASPSLQKTFSICDPIEFAEVQVRIYKHNFRKTTSVILK